MGRNTRATRSGSTSDLSHNRGRSASQKRTPTGSHSPSPTRASKRVRTSTQKASEVIFPQVAKRPLLKKARIAELKNSASLDQADSQSAPSKSQPQKMTSRTSQPAQSSQKAAPSPPHSQPEWARRSFTKTFSPSQDAILQTISTHHDTVDGPTWISSTEELSSNLSDSYEDISEKSGMKTPPGTTKGRNSHSQQSRINDQAGLDKEEEGDEEGEEESEEEGEEEDENEFEDSVSGVETIAFQPDDDVCVNGVEKHLEKLQKRGGSSRLENDVNREMQDLQIHSEAGHFLGLSLSTIESVRLVSYTISNFASTTNI